MTASVPPLVASSERGLLQRVAVAAAAAVAIVGLFAAIAGASISAGAARDGIERRAVLLARLTVGRLSGVPREQWGPLAQRTSSRAGCVISLLDPQGFVATGAPPPPLSARDPRVRGLRVRDEIAVDDTTYFVATEPLEASGTWRVIVAIPLTSRRGAVATLVVELLSVLTALGALGLGAALVVARDITNDVAAITDRARRMARGEAAVLEPLPSRAVDEVGALVTAFNRLQRRFGEELDAHRAALVRLEDAERRREALIATLRHELRTPLNSIIGFADLLLSGVDGELSAMQREDVEMIARSGAHLLTLVDDVLDLSAIASGRFSIHPEPVDVVDVAREVAREAEGFARRKKIGIVVVGEPHAIVEGDRVSLRRAITNLVHNAIEHAGGEVTIHIRLQGREAVIAVRDNGPGINPRDLKRLFKPFERGRSGESSRSGAGLGLAITVALVELHGGTLGAESEIGRGSTFIATLPLRMTALAQAGFE